MTCMKKRQSISFISARAFKVLPSSCLLGGAVKLAQLGAPHPPPQLTADPPLFSLPDAAAARPEPRARVQTPPLTFTWSCSLGHLSFCGGGANAALFHSSLRRGERRMRRQRGHAAESHPHTRAHTRTLKYYWSAGLLRSTSLGGANQTNMANMFQTRSCLHENTRLNLFMFVPRFPAKCFLFKENLKVLIAIWNQKKRQVWTRSDSKRLTELLR